MSLVAGSLICVRVEQFRFGPYMFLDFALLLAWIIMQQFLLLALQHVEFSFSWPHLPLSLEIAGANAGCTALQAASSTGTTPTVAIHLLPPSAVPDTEGTVEPAAVTAAAGGDAETAAAVGQPDKAARTASEAAAGACVLPKVESTWQSAHCPA